MRGRLRAERTAYEHALYGAWQGERFAREEKLQPFKRYLSQAKATNTAKPSQTPMEALAVFQGLQSAGIPIKITRIT